MIISCRINDSFFNKSILIKYGDESHTIHEMFFINRKMHIYHLIPKKLSYKFDLSILNHLLIISYYEIITKIEHLSKIFLKILFNVQLATKEYGYG